MKTEYKKLETGELNRLAELIKLYEEVFEMEDFTLPAAQYLQSLLEAVWKLLSSVGTAYL